MAAQVYGVEGMEPGLEHAQCLEEAAKCQRLHPQGKGDKQGTPKQMLTQALFPNPRGPRKECQMTPLTSPTHRPL